MANEKLIENGLLEDERMPYNRSLNEMQETAWHLSRQILQMTTDAGSGHPSSSLSAIDILTVLYFGAMMHYIPEEPDWVLRDRFILSKGHAAPALYAVLAEAGFFPTEKLSTLREMGSPLEGHPNMRVLPGVEASTGSLGQGLSIGLGHALAARVDDLDYRVYVLIGDGESDEGQIWEAAMAAAKYRVDNLTAILDYNKYQQTGSVNQVMPSLEPIVDKWEAFGWAVQEIDGHDIAQILEALQNARRVIDQPQMIIAHTRKGRGLSAFESDDVNRRHGEPLKEAELEQALAELDEWRITDEYSDEEPALTPEDVYGEL
jgi:transketolase